MTVLPTSNDPAETQAKVTAALQDDPAIDTVLALGAGTAGEPSVAAVEAIGKGQGTIKVASFDLLANFLESLAAGDAAFAIDQQQFLQGHLAVDFLALHADYGLMPGGNVASGPNLITADKAAQVVELSAKGIPDLLTYRGGGQSPLPPPWKGIDEATDAGSAAADERVRIESLISRLMKRPELGAVAGLILVTLFFMITADGSMFTLSGILNFLSSAAQRGILPIPAALLIIAGEFDLSIGSMVAFAGMIFGACVVNADLPLVLAIPLTLMFAALIGVRTGWWCCALVCHRSS